MGELFYLRLKELWTRGGDVSIRNIFIDELELRSHQDLSEFLFQIEKNFIALEKDLSKTENIAKVFHFFHIVKAASSLVSLYELYEICHESEGILKGALNKKNPLKSEIIQILKRNTKLPLETISLLKENGCIFNNGGQRPVLFADNFGFYDGLFKDYLMNISERNKEIA